MNIKKLSRNKTIHQYGYYIYIAVFRTRPHFILNFVTFSGSLSPGSFLPLISHPFIKKYLVLVGPGDLPEPPVVVVEREDIY